MRFFYPLCGLPATKLSFIACCSSRPLPLGAFADLRRKGITPSGSKFVMNGETLDAAGIATALRLQVGVGCFLNCMLSLLQEMR